MAVKNEYWYGEQETGDDGSLSVPFVTNTESTDTDRTDQTQRSKTKLYVGVGVLVVLLAGAGVGLSFYIKSLHTDSDDYNNTCYVAPSCTNVDPNHPYNLATGFTNNTGFASTATDECCNICYPSMPQTVCFTADPNCTAKTGQQDYDYLLLDQIYFPQWCTALDKENHDPTLSHLEGTHCTSAALKGAPLLNIHGFWPNYYHGFPQCCHTDTTSVAPLTPEVVQQWGALYTNMQQYWYDPTVDNANSDGTQCSTCYLQNHEWEKHGSCFTTDPEVYFASGLSVFDALTTNTATISGWNGTTVDTADIAALYTHKVNVLCDSQSKARTADTGAFIELQTCWNAVTSIVSSEELWGSGESSTSVSVSDSDSSGSSASTNVVGKGSVYYNKHTGRVLGNTIAQVQHTLRTTTAQTTLNAEVVVEVVQFQATDCMDATDGTFTMNCPAYTIIGNYETV